VSGHADKAFAAPRLTLIFLRPRTFSAGRANGAVTYVEGRIGDFALAAGHRLPPYAFRRSDVDTTDSLSLCRCRFQPLQALTDGSGSFSVRNSR
jgi:hypothetical protein